jgi:hypothetical protein
MGFGDEFPTLLVGFSFISPKRLRSKAPANP